MIQALDRSALIADLRRVIKRPHYPVVVMLACVRWYSAYPLSLRHIEEMMAERGVRVDRATIHRWALKILPVLAKVFRRRKCPGGSIWRMDETYILVAGEWKYLYRAVNREGETVDCLLTAQARPGCGSPVLRPCHRIERRAQEGHYVSPMHFEQSWHAAQHNKAA